MSKRYFRQTAACLVSVGVCATSMAADTKEVEGANRATDRQKLEEIVVTARRREESLNDVPLSIVAKNDEELVTAQVDAVDELYRVVPGLNFLGNGGGQGPQGAVNLRGFGSTNGSPGIHPTVGVSVDGVVMANTNAFFQDFGDIERVEVLRGPQGTLFGKNSAGGVLSIATKDPTEHLSGDLGLGYGSYDEVKTRGTIAGPLATDKLLARVSFFSTRRDGVYHDLTSGSDDGDDEQRGLRGTVLYRPAEGTRLRLSLYGIERDANFAVGSPVRELGPLAPPLVRQSFGAIAGPTNSHVNNGPGHFRFDTELWGSALQFDQSIGSHTLTSISSYVDWSLLQHQTTFGEPISASLGNTILVNFPFTERQWSEELRIASPVGGRIDYVAGVYVYRSTSTYHQNVLINRPAPAPGLFADRAAEYDQLNYAVFGEQNFHATDTVTLIAGARWTNEKNEMSGVFAVPPPGFANLWGASGVESDRFTTRNWSWRGGVRWKPTEDHMLYATAARGFKGGGFGAFGGFQRTQQVEPEVATTFEVGSKSSWFNRRLSASLAVYHTVFDDLQVTGLTIVRFPDGSPVTLPDGRVLQGHELANAAEARSRGVELEMQALPTENLTFRLSGAYVDAIYRRFPGATCYLGQVQFGVGCAAVPGTTPPLLTQDLSGTRLPFAPKFSGNLGADYDLKLGVLPFNGRLHIDYVWRGPVQWSSQNAPQGLVGGHGLLNASIVLLDKNDHYTLTVWGKNLTDKFNVASIFTDGFGVTRHQLAPDYRRIYGATVTYSF